MPPSKRPRRCTAKAEPANVPYDMGAFWDQHPHGEEIIIVFIAAMNSGSTSSGTCSRRAL
jgi:hypothetical protein